MYATNVIKKTIDNDFVDIGVKTFDTFDEFIATVNDVINTPIKKGKFKLKAIADNAIEISIVY